uniref:Uncharacterized protein n=1 Tax=Vespula pensylvanica TaxID=30213 RepID=A0A834PFY3_VESPE|nr:hypothetical protein H0235_000837 [Vespula pensylvanica]
MSKARKAPVWNAKSVERKEEKKLKEKRLKKSEFESEDLNRLGSKAMRLKKSGTIRVVSYETRKTHSSRLLRFGCQYELVINLSTLAGIKTKLLRVNRARSNVKIVFIRFALVFIRVVVDDEGNGTARKHGTTLHGILTVGPEEEEEEDSSVAM